MELFLGCGRNGCGWVFWWGAEKWVFLRVGKTETMLLFQMCAALQAICTPPLRTTPLGFPSFLCFYFERKQRYRLYALHHAISPPWGFYLSIRQRAEQTSRRETSRPASYQTKEKQRTNRAKERKQTSKAITNA